MNPRSSLKTFEFRSSVRCTKSVAHKVFKYVGPKSCYALSIFRTVNSEAQPKTCIAYANEANNFIVKQHFS